MAKSTIYNVKKGKYRDTCTVSIIRGQFKITKEYKCYRLPGDVWRLFSNDKE